MSYVFSVEGCSLIETQKPMVFLAILCKLLKKINKLFMARRLYMFMCASMEDLRLLAYRP